MILMVRRQKAFICPEIPADKEKSAEVFSKAASGIKAPPAKKQAQISTPRGGLRGRIMRR